MTNYSENVGLNRDHRPPPPPLRLPGASCLCPFPCTRHNTSHIDAAPRPRQVVFSASRARSPDFSVSSTLALHPGTLCLLTPTASAPVHSPVHVTIV